MYEYAPKDPTETRSLAVSPRMLKPKLINAYESAYVVHDVVECRRSNAGAKADPSPNPNPKSVMPSLLRMRQLFTPQINTAMLS